MQSKTKTDRQERKRELKALSCKIKAMDQGKRREFILKHGRVLTAENRELSEKNTCLVLMQYIAREDPIPAQVGGFKQWLKAGRAVNKGEKSKAVIYVPCTKKDDDGNDDTFFITVPVFDVDQTRVIN